MSQTLAHVPVHAGVKEPVIEPVVHAWARHGTTPVTPNHLPQPFVAIAPFRGDMGAV